MGITTLEEVFLKIAESPENNELDDDSKALKADSKKLLETGGEIEDYSVAEQHEEGYFNTFYLSLQALLKKKFLVQVRDPRTLIIEMLFPIIFIFAGLALATVKPIKPGVPRALSPEIFPTPSHLYFND